MIDLQCMCRQLPQGAAPSAMSCVPFVMATRLPSAGRRYITRFGRRPLQVILGMLRQSLHSLRFVYGFGWTAPCAGHTLVCSMDSHGGHCGVMIVLLLLLRLLMLLVLVLEAVVLTVQDVNQVTLFG